tara:strand:- start:866 stop:1045 length:180 start_codon:yes stop_codon:yes gene_type:complete
MIYPDRDLEELYIEHQSVWEEVWAGDLDLVKALGYMQVYPGEPLYDKARYCLLNKQPPL